VGSIALVANHYANAAHAWWESTNAADQNRLKAFIIRAIKHG